MRLSTRTNESATAETASVVSIQTNENHLQYPMLSRFLTLTSTTSIRIDAIESYETLSDTLLVQLRTGTRVPVRLSNNASFATTLQKLIGGFVNLGAALPSQPSQVIEASTAVDIHSDRPQFVTIKRNPLMTDVQTVRLDLIDAYEMAGVELILHMRSGARMGIPSALLQTFKATLALSAGEEIPLNRVVDPNRVAPNLGNEVDLLDPNCYLPDWAPLHRG